MNIDVKKLELLKKQLQRDEEEKCRRLLEERRKKLTGEDISKISNPVAKVELRSATRRRELPEEVRAQIYEAMQRLDKTQSPREQGKVEKELLSFGPEAVTPIIMWIPTVEYDAPDVRRVLVQVIGDLVRSDVQAREVMLELLEKGVPAAQKILCSVCGQIMAYDARDILVQLTRDPLLYYDACCTLIDLRALDALLSILEAVEQVNTEVKAELELAWDIMKRLARFGKDAVVPLAEHYVQCQAKAIRPLYTDALVRIGDPALPALEKMLGQPEYSREIATVLGRMKSAAAIDCLFSALEEGKGNRRWILHGLSRTGDKRSIDIFEKLLKSDQLPPEEKSELILALGNLGHREPGLYKRYLNVKEKSLYVDAAMALAQIGQENGFSLLISVLLSGPERDRSRAITHLGRLKGEAVRRILPFLEVENDENSVYLVQALGKTHVINNEVVVSLTRRLPRAGEELRLELYRFFAGHAEAVRDTVNGSKPGELENKSKKYWNKVALEVLYKGRQMEKARSILQFLNKSIDSATRDSRGKANIIYREDEKR